jgi:hypothetical protein
MNVNALLVAGGAGLAAQLIMVISGHYVAFIKNGFGIVGTAISLLAGLAYAMIAAGSWGSTLAGGFLAGGVCALIGIAVSYGLKDVDANILLFGTLGSGVAGIIGAAIGKAIG